MKLGYLTFWITRKCQRNLCKKVNCSLCLSLKAYGGVEEKFCAFLTVAVVLVGNGADLDVLESRTFWSSSL